MKNTWILSIRTSLPKTCKCMDDMKIRLFVYDSFEKAKLAFREKIRDYAFSENSMFDGNGHIIWLDNYATDMYGDSSESPYKDELEDLKGRLISLRGALVQVFSGDGVSTRVQDDVDYYDGMFTAEYKDGVLSVLGCDDGPCNGYEPYIKTNITDMSEEKDYFLYINDLFGQDWSSELYFDLKKADN